MPTTDHETGQTSGVDRLIRRVRDEGVTQARQESETLLEDARREAREIVETARVEADRLRTSARAEIDTEREAAMASLRLAARDAVLELTSGVARAFEEHVKRLVTEEATDVELLRTVILVLAGKVREEVTLDKDLEIMVSQALFEPERGMDERLADRAKQQILAVSKAMLREGVELIPASDVAGGARVRLVGERVEVDLTDEAISHLLLRYMQPRFVSILRGAE